MGICYKWSYSEELLIQRIQKEFRVEKIIKRKDDKLYVKWKGYDNSWINVRQIDKKYIAQISEYFPKPKSIGANVKCWIRFV